MNIVSREQSSGFAARPARRSPCSIRGRIGETAVTVSVAAIVQSDPSHHAEATRENVPPVRSKSEQAQTPRR